MIVTACDGKNMSVVLDLLHAKLLVELVRTLNMDAHSQAVKVVTTAGFLATVLDSVVASGSFISIVGQYTDNMRNGDSEKKEDPPAGIPDPPGEKATVQ